MENREWKKTQVNLRLGIVRSCQTCSPILWERRKSYVLNSARRWPHVSVMRVMESVLQTWDYYSDSPGAKSFCENNPRPTDPHTRKRVDNYALDPFLCILRLRDSTYSRDICALAWLEHHGRDVGNTCLSITDIRHEHHIAHPEMASQVDRCFFRLRITVTWNGVVQGTLVDGVRERKPPPAEIQCWKSREQCDGDRYRGPLGS